MAYNMLGSRKSVSADGAWIALLLLWVGIVSSHLRLWEMQEGVYVAVIVGREETKGGESVIR